MAETTNKNELSDIEIISNKSSTPHLRFAHHNIKQRRLPLFFTKTKDNIYVTYKSSFKAQLNRCEKCFNSGVSEITIHGLGRAVNRACNLALQLKNNHNGILDLDIKTSTVELTDDIEPSEDDDEYGISNRNKSAIHIRVFKTAELGPLKYAK